MRNFRKIFFGCLAALAGVACLVNAVRYEQISRHQKDEERRRFTIDDPFKSIKDGGSSVRVSDLELLELLSNNAECTENLVSVTFSYLTFRPSDGQNLEKLKNLVSIGFYSCKNVDVVIPKCFGSQVHTISMDTTMLSQESIDMLREARSIDVTMNGRNIREEL
jgi:hypothetical protein